MRERVAVWFRRWKEVFRKWKKGWKRKSRPESGLAPNLAATAKQKSESEHAKVLEDLRVAHLEWVCAQKRLDYVLDDDEIDYAIFALETAEKRYGMLLKQAKALQVRAGGFGLRSVSRVTSSKGFHKTMKG